MEFGALLPVALFIQCLIGNSDRMIVSSCYVLMALFIRWHDAMASHAMVVMFSVFARLAQVLEYQMSQYTVCVFLSGTYVPKLIPDTSRPRPFTTQRFFRRASATKQETTTSLLRSHDVPLQHYLPCNGAHCSTRRRNSQATYPHPK